MQKPVVIMGLGRYEQGSGISATKFFISQNKDIVITDLQSKEDLSEQVERIENFAKDSGYTGKIEWKMGGHDQVDFVNAAMIVRGPGVPIESEYLQQARKAGVPIESDQTLFFKNCPAPIIGVTGTRGKSTTTALIGHLLQTEFVGGNIGISPLNFLDKLDKNSKVVLELSSWLLESLNEHKLSPHIAVITNVLEDHLNRYNNSMDEYAAAKEFITAHQKSTDFFICNKSNSYTKAMGERSKASVIWYDPQNDKFDYKLNLVGNHNKANAMAAVKVAELHEVSQKLIQERLLSFKAPHSRLEQIAEINGVKFVNDTTATTPDATIAALNAFKDKQVHLIVGGNDKGLDFSSLAQLLPPLKSTIWLPGTGTNRLYEALDDAQVKLSNKYEANSMQEAVEIAKEQAKSGDVILLSPACTSFGLFKNEFDRGEQFNKAVKL